MHIQGTGLSVGKRIDQKDLIGTVGKTGIFDPPGGKGRPHLHFIIGCGGWDKQFRIDPMSVYSNKK